jgi:HK97 family phage major capsid protein
MSNENRLRVKIHVPSGAVERKSKAEKKIKEDNAYHDTGWRVLGVPYGGPIKGRDLDGEAFHEDTDVWLKTGDEVNLTYYHGYGPDDPEEWQETPVVIGRATYTGFDKRGHWFEPRLDLDEPLAQRLIKADIEDLRASSGAVAHLVRMGKGGLVDVWPVGELALFDTNDWRLPANDFAVIEAKTETVTEALPESVETLVDAVGDSVDAKNNSTQTSIPEEEYTTMTDEKVTQEKKEDVQEQSTEQTDVLAEVKALMEDQKEQQKKELEEFKLSVIEVLKKAEPGVERGTPVVMKAANLGDPDPIKDFNNWVRTGVGRIKKHTVERELVDGRGGTYKAALQEGTDSEGGYLVPADYLNRIIEKRSEQNILEQLGVETFTTDRDTFNFPAEDTSMTKFTIVSEEGAVSDAENEPDFAQVSTTLYKFMKVIKISSELDEDYNTGLSNRLASMIGRAWAATENYYVQVGTGSSQPQGAFVGGTAGLTLDSASAISPDEIPELIGKLKTPYRDRAVMLMHRTTGAYLSGLTGNQFQFKQPPVSQTWANGEDLGIGYPIILTEDAAEIGASAKSLLFGNFEFYGWVRNRSLRIQRLTELYAGNDQIGLHAKFRAGGAVLQAEAFQYATHPTA